MHLVDLLHAGRAVGTVAGVVAPVVEAQQQWNGRYGRNEQPEQRKGQVDVLELDEGAVFIIVVAVAHGGVFQQENQQHHHRHHRGDHQEYSEGAEVVLIAGEIGVGSRRTVFLGSHGVGQQRGDGCDGSHGAGVIVAVAERGRHDLADYAAAGDVGQHPFEAVAGAYGDLPLILDNQNKQTVVPVGLAEAPQLEQVGGELRGVLGVLDVVNGHNHWLDGERTAQRVERGVYGADGLRRQDSVGIGHIVAAVGAVDVGHGGRGVDACGGRQTGDSRHERHGEGAEVHCSEGCLR